MHERSRLRDRGGIGDARGGRVANLGELHHSLQRRARGGGRPRLPRRDIRPDDTGVHPFNTFNAFKFVLAVADRQDRADDVQDRRRVIPEVRLFVETVQLFPVVANLQDGLRLHVHRKQRARDGRVPKTRVVRSSLFALRLTRSRSTRSRRIEPVPKPPANLSAKFLQRDASAVVQRLTRLRRKPPEDRRDDRAERRAPRAVPAPVRAASPLARAERDGHGSVRARAHLGDHPAEHPLAFALKRRQHRGVIQRVSHHKLGLAVSVLVPERRHRGAKLGEQRG